MRGGFTAPDFQSTFIIGLQDIVWPINPIENAIFADEGRCPHFENEQPDSTGSNGNVQYMLLENIVILENVADTYFAKTGAKLSLNDASLMFGGVVDNYNGNGRLARCHVSHRHGKDIDLNSASVNGLPVQYNSQPYSRERYLDILFDEHQVTRGQFSSGIHYDFK